MLPICSPLLLLHSVDIILEGERTFRSPDDITCMIGARCGCCCLLMIVTAQYNEKYMFCACPYPACACECFYCFNQAVVNKLITLYRFVLGPFLPLHSSSLLSSSIYMHNKYSEKPAQRIHVLGHHKIRTLSTLDHIRYEKLYRQPLRMNCYKIKKR